MTTAMMDAKQLWPGRVVKTRVMLRNGRTDLRYHPPDGTRPTFPEGTRFHVGGVHLVEGWADLHAESHGIQMRFTFEEIGRLFEWA